MTSHLRRPSAVIGIVLCLALAAACAPSDCRRVPAPLPGRHRGHVRRGRTGVGGAAPAARVRAHPVRDARPRSAGGICLGPNSRSRSAWARSGCLGSTRVMATFDGLNHALRRARRLSGRRGEESIASKPALRSLRREADRSIGRSIASCTPNCPTTFQGVPSQTAASQIRRLAQYGTASGPTIVGPDPGRALDLEVALSWDFAVGLDRLELSTSALSVLRSNRLSYSPRRFRRLTPRLPALASRRRPSRWPLPRLPPPLPPLPRRLRPGSSNAHRWRRGLGR